MDAPPNRIRPPVLAGRGGRSWCHLLSLVFHMKTNLNSSANGHTRPLYSIEYAPPGVTQPIWADRVDFIALSAAFHQPAVLCEESRLLGSVLVYCADYTYVRQVVKQATFLIILRQVDLIPK
ncbi:MAG: hypothetical protein FVQ83_14570 [Chloroflexi bacterium]|nr:hypothetical protein [Chloroflexota bacterium]